MARQAARPHTITRALASRIWLRAQRLDVVAPFGEGPAATPAAVEHLGYVQIDTINVIERSHHHILYSRIPAYRREHLRQAQTVDKTVFEYWTHALAYVPAADFRYFIPAMRRHRRTPMRWFGPVGTPDMRRILARIRREGPLTIRDIDDDVLVDKEHPWASRKPSKRALQLGFLNGVVTVSERNGMLKTYELIERHFGWDKLPKAATEREIAAYMLDRALRAQGIVSLDSTCHLNNRQKPGVRRLIEGRVRRGELVPVAVEGIERAGFWARLDVLEDAPPAPAGIVHLLSPFDPLVILRRRLQHFFDYEHRFEAYVPEDKRQFGYFALPVLVDEAIVAAIDLKTDRAAGKLLVRKWTWVGKHRSRALRQRIEEQLHLFEKFQLAR